MNSDWLSQLAPAHAPPSASWWPLAPGWWILIVLAVTAIATVTYWQTRPLVRLRRAALRELKDIEFTAADDDAMLARRLEHLLRRVALARFGHAPVASLSGVNWITFVVEHGGTAWSGETGSNLLRAAYGGTSTPERERWLTGARDFIKAKSRLKNDSH